jgi:hypothetical protein
MTGLADSNPRKRLEALLEVAEAAKAFVSTTSYFRQPRSSRAEFEALAIALIKAESA